MRIGHVKTVLRYYHEISEMLKLLKQEQEDLEDEYNGLRGINMDGLPHGSTPGNPTEMLVEKLDAKNVWNRLEEISVKSQVLHADAAVIRDCLDSLSGKYKRVIAMRYFDKYSWAQIAVQIGTPDSTARNWHDRAVTRLGEALEEVPMVEELVRRASRARD